MNQDLSEAIECLNEALTFWPCQPEALRLKRELVAEFERRKVLEEKAKNLRDEREQATRQTLASITRLTSQRRFQAARIKVEYLHKLAPGHPATPNLTSTIETQIKSADLSVARAKEFLEKQQIEEACLEFTAALKACCDHDGAQLGQRRVKAEQERLIRISEFSIQLKEDLVLASESYKDFIGRWPQDHRSLTLFDKLRRAIWQSLDELRAQSNWTAVLTLTDGLASEVLTLVADRLHLDERRNEAHSQIAMNDCAILMSAKRLIEVRSRLHMLPVNERSAFSARISPVIEEAIQIRKLASEAFQHGKLEDAMDLVRKSLALVCDDTSAISLKLEVEYRQQQILPASTHKVNQSSFALRSMLVLMSIAIFSVTIWTWSLYSRSVKRETGLKALILAIEGDTGEEPIAQTVTDLLNLADRREIISRVIERGTELANAGKTNLNGETKQMAIAARQFLLASRDFEFGDRQGDIDSKSLHADCRMLQAHCEAQIGDFQSAWKTVTTAQRLYLELASRLTSNGQPERSGEYTRLAADCARNAEQYRRSAIGFREGN
jgi:hypothetical protein